MDQLNDEQCIINSKKNKKKKKKNMYSFSGKNRMGSFNFEKTLIGLRNCFSRHFRPASLSVGHLFSRNGILWYSSWIFYFLSLPFTSSDTTLLLLFASRYYYNYFFTSTFVFFSNKKTLKAEGAEKKGRESDKKKTDVSRMAGNVL